MKTFILAIACALSVLISVPSVGRQWRNIVNSEKLIIGVKDNLRPLGYRNDQGNLEGLEIDIAKRLAKELLGKEDALILHTLSNQKRLQAVMDAQVDVVIAGISVNSSRRRVVDFSPYYYFDGTGIVTQNPNLQTDSDFAQKTIAIIENSSNIPVVKYNLPTANLIGVKSYQEALSLLEAGKADGFVGDLTVLSGWIQEYPHYHLVTSNWSSYPLAIAMPKGLQYQELRQKISALIKQWHQDGWLEERAKYWGLPQL
jgi:polar amino acid transport system substrate-binding protein